MTYDPYDDIAVLDQRHAVPTDSRETFKNSFSHMEYIARTFKMLLHVERFQEKNEKICINLERHYLSHTFDFLLRLLYRGVLCIGVAVSIYVFF